ncbi:hypothetical protein BHYA_0104g00310 [Botrytis hyacinthi]|uniref:C3H1-type domain-containing protein n=1 Tax=Botrytis hyacinthi TaxID=278943 RepID=A0A4Z1GUM9_9HELO|nr:hypothetical protein BHYA_0104g00310 [Botrytis hyacinthi]
MDGDNHGYIPDDVDFDGLLSNGSVWPNTADQYAYQQPQSQSQQQPQQQPQQQHIQSDPYGRYSNIQPSYGQYDLSHQSHQQPTYNALSYTNSPAYAAAQYQHARPSDMFTPTSYGLDPSMQESNSYHGAQSSFPYQQNTTQHPTISPQTLQYSLLAQQQMNSGIPSAAFQRSNSGIGSKPNYNYGQRTQSNDNHFFNQPQNGIVPQKMDQNSSNNTVRYPSIPTDLVPKEEVKQHVPITEQYSAPAPAVAVPRQREIPELQPIAPAPNPLRVTHPDLVANNTSSRPRFSYAPFLAWEDTPIQVPPALKNTIPKYHPRKSRSGKELVPGLNKSKISTTPAKISQKNRAPKQKKTHVSTYKGTGRSAFDKDSGVRSDGTNTPTKSSTPTESSTSEEETSSEEESDYEDEEEEDMPPPIDISTVRELTRPSDIPSAARWDAIGIVWKDPNSSPSAAAITSAMNDYANTFIALRTQIKDDTAKLQEATASKAPEVQLQKLKSHRSELSEALYQTIEAANKLGYVPIVENLGGHQKLVSGLTATLIECTKTEDYIGKLPRAVFALLAKFRTLTEDLLTKSKFDALAKRWNKKGDQEIKNYIKVIMDNTVDAKGRASKIDQSLPSAEDAKKKLEKIEQIKSRATESLKPTATNPNSKRPHEGDNSNGKPNKKFASDVSGTPTSTTKLPPIPKRSNVNLLGISSSKSTPKPAPKVAPPKKKEPSPPPPPPMSSRLGDILASIEKPPEAPKKASPAAGPPETPEEKKRRERKESRRHLRVKFKPDDELEQIRLFKHEVAEDEGRQDGMLRDARNNHSEGMMHKQRVQATDEDDDEVMSGMIDDRPYPTLVEVDLSNLDKHTTYGPSYITRGGNVKFVTPEQQEQERREANELLVIYNDPSEIPPSAKEPSSANDAATGMVKQLKYPNAPWLIQRLQDIHQYGPEYARTLAISRLEERKYKEMLDSQARGFTQNASSSNNGMPALQQLAGASKSNPIMDVAWENLQRVVATLKGKPYPAIEPPEWMNEAQKKDWWNGYNKDHPNAVEERLLAQMQAPQAPPAPSVVPPMSVPQMQGYQPQMAQPVMNYQVAVPDVNQQVQQYLASLTGNNNTSADTPTSSSTPQQFDFSAWSNNPALQGYAPSLPTDSSSRWPGHQSDENRDTRGGKNNYNNDKWRKQGKDWKKDTKWEPLDENGQYKGKKQPCKFWGEGKCAKGAACTYSHEPEDQGRDRY